MSEDDLRKSPKFPTPPESPSDEELEDRKKDDTGNFPYRVWRSIRRQLIELDRVLFPDRNMSLEGRENRAGLYLIVLFAWLLVVWFLIDAWQLRLQFDALVETLEQKP